MALETLTKLWRVIPDMGGELGPPEDAFLVEEFLIMEVVGLMGKGPYQAPC